MVAAFALLALLVGTNRVAIRFTNRELAPLSNAGSRFLLSSAGFAVIAIARHAPPPSRGQRVVTMFLAAAIGMERIRARSVVGAALVLGGLYVGAIARGR